MAEQVVNRLYNTPPIVEALVQIAYAEPLGDSLYRKLAKRLKREYANELALETINAKLNFPAREADFDATPQMRYSSADETDVFVAMPLALTWSRLAPYEGWSSLIDRVRRESAFTAEVTGYRKPARLGVRYVNRLDVPSRGEPLIRYEDYLTINISVPDQWEALDNYAWRIERRFGKFQAVVQSAIIEPEMPDTGAFLLDIDVIAMSDVPAKLEEQFVMLEEMRVLKNNIFEASVTDLARASFKS